jgi:DNA polymerase III subunit delta
MGANIHVFYGSESLLIRYRIERLVKETRADEYNITTYDAEETDVSQAIQDAMTPPFMSQTKVVIIRRPYFLSTEKSQIQHRLGILLDYLKSPMDTTCLIFHAWDLKFDEKNPIVQELRKVAEFVESKKLSDVEFAGWMKRQLAQEDITIDEEAVRTFYQMVGKDMNNAQNEVDKLMNYVGANAHISTKIVKAVVVKEIESDIYALSNAIMSRDRNRIIPLYHELIESGMDASVLFGSCARAIKDSYVVRLMIEEGMKQTEIAEKLKISPGRAFYVMRDSKNMEMDRLTYFLSQFAELDYKIKSGQIDLKTGFEFLLFQL